MNNHNFFPCLLTLTLFSVLAAGCTSSIVQKPVTTALTIPQPIDVKPDLDDSAFLDQYQNDLDGLAIRIEELESEGYDTVTLWDLYTNAEVSLFSARAAQANGDTLNYDLAMSDFFEYTDALEPIRADNS